MSLQWTFVATFLYTEIFICCLLLLPIISPCRWQKLFRSRLLNAFRSYANLYFNVFIIVLVILFLDALREMRRQQEHHGQMTVTTPEMTRISTLSKLFRAQRNSYVSGFVILLWIVLRRLITLISDAAKLDAANVALKSQAEGASATAKQLMEEKDNKSNEGQSKDIQAQLDKALDDLSNLKQELSKTSTDRDTIKKQAESTNKEYDRLLNEHAKLQARVAKLEGDGDTKKDD